jgi:hypothetical protein
MGFVQLPAITNAWNSGPLDERCFNGMSIFGPNGVGSCGPLGASKQKLPWKGCIAEKQSRGRSVPLSAVRPGGP